MGGHASDTDYKPRYREDRSMTPTTIRLLLIVDKPGDSRVVQEALAEQAPGEFAITTSERLADALVRIQTDRFDAVLCDLDLPDSAGLDTAKAIIAASPETTLVVLMPEQDVPLGRTAIELGAQDYLHKGELVPPLISRTPRYAVERKRILADLRKVNASLEIRVSERTADLEAAIRALQQQSDALRRQNDELERFKKISVGRELGMIDLKRQVNALSRELGRAEPFNLAFADASPPPAAVNEANASSQPAAGLQG